AGPSAPPAPATNQASGGLIDNMTSSTQAVPVSSPIYGKTWVTYYGRPGIPVMGILGEYSIDGLVPRLREQAAAYDQANGPNLGVTPAFHLIYGMATDHPQGDGSHLAYLSDDLTRQYIERAGEEGFGVILDIQIGSLYPLTAMQAAFPYLQYPNVHLALDPEFRMTEPNQAEPGKPPGHVTAAQINEVQNAMVDYMEQNGIGGRRILIVHQFLDSMIVNKQAIAEVDRIELTVTADGFGRPVTKVSKYNRFMTPDVEFAGFKLFYRWDDPLLTEREVLGIDQARGAPFMEVTPNLIIYQ
ncbi:MAG: hypothetical protein M3220_22590, partial [Chloroflexota bacterium]|nr:hypothetical protein [Chloroflexota bacterium]